MYQPIMAARPVQISLEQGLLKRIDADPEARKRGRSAFIRSAVELYLRAKERRELDRAILRAYGPVSDDLLAEVEELIPEQQWPER